MSYLLDTHAVLWLLADDPRINGVRAQLSEPRARVLLSAVCLWESAVKSALGKLVVPPDLPARLEQFAFEPVPVTAEHAWAVRDLPAHHSDPFDRLLIAQAQSESATLVSRDVAFDQYGVPRIW